MIEPEEDTICLSKEQYSVYSCICYFDIFRHPLKPEEICDFMNMELGKYTVKFILEELVDYGLVFYSKGYYSLEKENTLQISKRHDSERRFLRKQKTISRYAGLIARFPYVESVSISGSCSKGLLDEEGDVDYFIITSPKRLWLCRTILIAFKKIFLLNSKKYFCLNYFVDAETLEVPDKNIFVASEIRTLTPISNRELFEKFLKSNEWTSGFLPNKKSYSRVFLKENKPRKYLFGLIELLFNNRLGKGLDNWCYGLTLSTWKKRFPEFDKGDFELNFRSKKSVSKHHPRGFQKKVLVELHKKLDKIKVLNGS